MEKYLQYLLIILSLTFNISKLSAQAFTIGSPSNDYTITCANPVVTMTANAGTAPFSYTWTGPSGTLTGNSVQINVPGPWACTGRNTVTSYSNQLSFMVYSNMQQPTVVVTPTVNNITCAGSSGCFTLTSNLGPNVTTNWFAVMGANSVYVGAAQGTINIFCPSSPGVYWGESISNVTGCKATKSVQVTASVGVPMFTVTSPTNFTLGCGSTSVTSMQVSQVITSPVASVTTTYAFMSPPVTSTPTTFTVNPNLNNITIPGTYVVYVKDINNNCVSSQSFSVLQNTVTPNVYCLQPLSLVDCKNTSMVLTGISSNTNTTITWTIPPTNSVNPTPSQTVNINPSLPNASTMLTSLGFYSVGVTDNNSQCRNTHTVQIIQDLRKPIFTIANLTNSVISCSNPSVTLLPIITPTLAVALVPTYTWYPPPYTTGYPGTQYDSYTPGTHSAISTSGVNGCTISATYNIASDNSIGAFGGIIGVSCPIATAVVSPTFVTSASNLTFTWTGPPGAILSPVNQSTILVNAIGVYSCAITSLSNSCNYTIYCSVQCANGLLSQNFSTEMISVYPNPSNGKLSVELSFANARTKLTVFDAQGKLVFESSLINKLNKVETNLPKGYYLYRISSENQVLKKDKLIIE
jgi:hypothetical protein